MDYNIWDVREQGHNIGNPELNTAGVVYISFVCFYSIFLVLCTALLWANRATTAVRIRGFWITVLAVVVIHAYVAALFIVYPLNGWFRCGTEFWFMNTVLPTGIALFQASNARLMSYSQTQADVVASSRWQDKPRRFKCALSYLRKWCRTTTSVTTTYILICIGLAVQICVTSFIFFSSRRFNPSTGWFGQHVDPVACRRGFEWIPSVVWQFLWAWVFGPYVLFKTRHIKDVHYWAWQTRIAVIAGLPGTPLWLNFLNSNNPEIAKIVAWWPPALWFAPGLMVMQLSALIVPLFDIYNHGELNRRFSRSSLTLLPVSHNPSFSSRNSREIAGNYKVFLFQLDHNIQPIFIFAATKDFTAENIQFLVEARDFKRKWTSQVGRSPFLNDPGSFSARENRSEMFKDAARIYFELISSKTSICPINIDAPALLQLGAMFKGLRFSVFDAATRQRSVKSTTVNFSRKVQPRDLLKLKPEKITSSTVAPWISDIEPDSTHGGMWNTNDSDSDTALNENGLDDNRSDSRTELLVHPDIPAPVAKPWLSAHSDADCIRRLATQGTSIVGPRFQSVVTSYDRKVAPACVSALDLPSTELFQVPTSFSVEIFDKIEKNIKWLVYTNTWKSYIEDMSDEDFECYTQFISARDDIALTGSNVHGSRISPPLTPHSTDIELQEVGVAITKPTRITNEELGVLAKPTTVPSCGGCGQCPATSTCDGIMQHNVYGCNTLHDCGRTIG